MNRPAAQGRRMLFTARELPGHAEQKVISLLESISIKAYGVLLTVYPQLATQFLCARDELSL